MNELQLIQCRLAYNHVFQNPILAIHMPEKGKSSQLSLRTLKVELLQRLDADGFPCQVRICKSTIFNISRVVLKEANKANLPLCLF
jgi:hypothetical protein